MKKRNKQILGLLLSLTMVGSVLPATAYAAPQEAQTQEATAEQSDNAEAQQDVSDEQTVDATEEQPAEEQQTEEQTPAEEETATQAADNGETEVAVTGGYTISVPTINFQGANAAVAEALTKDVKIDESDPAIKSLREALEDIEIVGGEAGIEDDVNAIATYDAEEKKNALSEDQINNVVGMYQQYLNQWAENANVLGVQNPFFLDFNDEKDGLGILGEMLALDGASVDDVRNGKYSYDDLTGMIINFMYGDKLGIQYYGSKVTSARDEALAAVDASGAQTKAQKLLVLNDWLAHNNTFDMAYIMNSGKETEDDKPMIAANPQKQEHEDDVYNVLYDFYTQQITANFHDQIFAGIEDDLRKQFYENAIQNAVYQQVLGKKESEATDEEKQTAQDQAKAYVEQNKEAIDEDPDGYTREKFGDEAADQIKEQADAFIKNAEENGIEVQEGVTMTVEELTQNSMKSEKIVDLDQDGTADTTANDAIPIYADQAAKGLTTGVLNYWEGTQFGALGFGKSVCLGYSKAYTYLVQCMDKKVYLNDASKGYDDSSNWKTAKDLYYTDGKLDITKNYTVDLVRISFQSDVTMYGEEQENFASDHYWNAVQIDGQWYYIDPCYTDVYTEVMSRDRVETDGDMNHAFFLFSETSTESLYDGNYSAIRSLYKSAATDKTYETSWIARAASNVYYADGYAYYLYDSTDLFSRTNMNQNQKSTEYKLVRHKLTSDDTKDGDSDYETLINFTTKDNDDDEDTYVTVLNKDGKMEKNDMLTKLYAQFVDEQSVYPSIGLTAAMYNGKLYFNVSNDVVSYDPADGSVAVVKEYNTVSAKRDTTKLFGGMAFSTTDEKSADFTVTNHPIAGLTVKGDELVVSIATNFAFISGKSDILDHTSYGYEFEETDYNPTYTNYKKYQQIMGSQNNDNDEFMWSANFVDTVNMKTLTGTSHNYEKVSVPAYCGRNAFTEERCSDCGLVKDGTRVEEEGTAHEHHYIKFHEVYYTKDDSGNRNEADNYVCPECGACITEPVKSKYEQANSTYEKRKAIWDAAQENEKEGHAYTVEDAEWSEDGSKVTFQNLKCESCAAEIDKLDCLLSTDENATNKANRDSIEKTLSDKVTADAELVSHTGTCDTGVSANYKAEGKTEDGYKYVATKKITSEAGEHQFAGTFAWEEVKDDDGNVTGYTAKVEDVKCSVCGEKPSKDDITVDVKKDEENSIAATCDEDGKDVYVATATIKGTDDKEIGTLTDTKEVEVKALGHDYGEPTWNWEKGENNTYVATASFTCANDSSHVEVVNADVKEKSEGATCDKAGKITYTATATFDGKDYTDSKTEESNALGHKYGEPSWKWSKDDSADTYTAVATFVCERCEDTKKEVVDAIEPVITAATCDTAGNKAYTATVKFNDKEYTDTKNVEVKALGHDYGEPTWSAWEEKDGEWTTVATFTCANDKAHVETPKVEVTSKTSDATCEKAGTVTYTATTEFNGKTYTNKETKVVEGQALGHDYGEVKWTWGEDNKTATAEVTCKRDGCGHKESVEAKVTSETTAATCEVAGKTVYTATAEIAGKTVTDTKEVEIKALGHNYGEPTWNWEKGENNTYVATASFTCVNDSSHVEVVNADVKEKSEGATCDKAGKITYTATVTFNGKDYTDSKTEESPALGHNYEATWSDWKKVDGKWMITATAECTRCHDKHSETVEGTKDESQSTKATYKSEGKDVYVATAVIKDGDTVIGTFELPAEKNKVIKYNKLSYTDKDIRWETKDGKTYCYILGTKVVGEEKIQGSWYYFDEDGVMQTGFVTLNDKTVYYGTDGKMCYGEQKINDKWYYFDKVTGAMATGLTNIGSKTVYYNAEGQMQYGEVQIGTDYYYFHTVTGAMQKGLVKTSAKTAYYGTDGKRVSGEQKIGNSWYYFDKDTGAMATGFRDLGSKTVYYSVSDGKMCYGEQKIGDKWYYFNTVTGAMATGLTNVGSKTVYYNAEGQMQYGEVQIGTDYYYFHTVTGAMQKGLIQTSGKTAYYGTDGKRVSGEQKIGNSWYYFDEATGAMVTGFKDLGSKIVYYGVSDGKMRYGEQKIGNDWYYFDKVSGAMATGFTNLGSKKVYYSSEGKMQYGEVKVGNDWYYFDKVTGAMATDKFVDLKDKTVYYGSNGKMYYGEKKVGNDWYYFNTGTGAMAKSEFVDLGNKTVYYNEQGKMCYGEKKINGNWYYFDTVTGEMAREKFVNIKDKTVYYDADGHMVYGSQTINGKTYYFDPVTGAMKK